MAGISWLCTLIDFLVVITIAVLLLLLLLVVAHVRCQTWC